MVKCFSFQFRGLHNEASARWSRSRCEDWRCAARRFSFPLEADAALSVIE
jgi:hypothetical protein